MAMNVTIPTVPRYQFRFQWEEKFDIDSSHVWIVDNFYLTFVFSILYILLVFIGQRGMKNKAPLELKTLMFVWNLCLAVFGLCTAIRLAPEFLYGYIHFGFKHTMCSFCFFNDNPVSGFWSYAFVLSKLVELLDTSFLVLRKKKVIFLHWFHHCSVLIFTWFLLKDKAAIGRWFMNMNAIVHWIMYTYYALSALNVRISKTLAQCITMSQVLQMIVGAFISLQGFIIWMKGEKCDISGTAAISGIAIYALYLVLFLNFFVNAYLLPRKKFTKKSM